MFTHFKTINGHHMQIATDGGRFAAWVRTTCCRGWIDMVASGVCEWDATDPTYAVDHSSGVKYAR